MGNESKLVTLEQEKALSDLRRLAEESKANPNKPVEDWTPQLKEREAQRPTPAQAHAQLQAQRNERLQTHAQATEVLHQELSGKLGQERLKELEAKLAVNFNTIKEREAKRLDRLELLDERDVLSDEYVQTLKADPALCRQTYTEAIKQFAQKEIEAGRTPADLSRFHSRQSINNGFETQRLELAGQAFRRLYGHGTPDSDIFEETLKSLYSDTSPSESKERRSNAAIRDMVIEQYLSYQDAALPTETKQSSLEFSRKSPSASAYAETLLEMTGKYNLYKVEQAAKGMVKECDEVLTQLGILPTPYSKSKTWAMWDIGKQYYYFTHPEKADAGYTLGDPLESDEKRQEIVNRHIGWEAFAAFTKRGNKDFIRHVPKERRETALEYLGRVPKENGTLSSKELAELGALLRN